jgi:DNA-binding CsgD family transcriptional regulator
MQSGDLNTRWRSMQELIDHIAEPLAVVSINTAREQAELVLLSGGATKLLAASSTKPNDDTHIHEFYRLCLRGTDATARRLVWQAPAGDAYRLNAITLGCSKPGPLLLVRFHRENGAVSPNLDLPELEATAQERGMSHCEARVFALMARGLSNKEIAQKLDISYHTTRSHLRNIFRTLNVSNRAEARETVFG